MKTEQTWWTRADGWQPQAPGQLEQADLVMVFAGSSVLRDGDALTSLRKAHPGAHIFGCSTAGEIAGTCVRDDSLVATAVQFEGTRLQFAEVRVDQDADSRAAGERLAGALSHDELVHVFVLSDGLRVNGSELVRGLANRLPEAVSITGGLSADGERFQETRVIVRSGPETGAIAAIGFYGKRLRVGYASLGGWDSFGPERMITRSEGNVLYELDGRSALDLYKTYLGEHAAGLPATGLLFPLSVRTNEGDTAVVRTILSIDEDRQSLTFAGDVPTGSLARLMKANFDRLVDGAFDAAQTSREAIGSSSPELALLVSCVGRKMVLKQRIEEEVEAVREVLGNDTAMTGFYSYGEISPFTPNAKCELHNQTMTITTFSEKPLGI